MLDTDYEPSDGHALHVWIGGSEDDRELWACTLYAHGPFCRLCQLVDGVLNVPRTASMPALVTLKMIRRASDR